MTLILAADIGAKALLLLYIWLISAIGASAISNRKGYGEKMGLGFGLLLSLLGLIIWIFWPAKPDSSWKTRGWRATPN